MKVCPKCRTEFEHEGACMICDLPTDQEYSEESGSQIEKRLRCSPFGLGCIVALQMIVPLATIAYLVYAFGDLMDGNLLQLLIIPANLFLSITLCTLLGLAISYAEGGDFPENK